MPVQPAAHTAPTITSTFTAVWSMVGPLVGVAVGVFRPMKFVSAFLAVFVLGALAQTSSAPVVIKDEFGPVMFLRFSPNGGELARMCAFGPVALFDTTSYRRARTFRVPASQLMMVAYSLDGTRIATAEGYHGARVWNAADPGKPESYRVSRFWLSVDELYVLDTRSGFSRHPAPPAPVHWKCYGPGSPPTANF